MGSDPCPQEQDLGFVHDETLPEHMLACVPQLTGGADTLLGHAARAARACVRWRGRNGAGVAAKGQG